jgi:hypothetical protein
MLRTEGHAHLELILKWLKCRVKSRKLQLALPTLTSSTMHSKAIRLSHTHILPFPERLREEFSGRQEGRGVQHRDLQRAVLGIEPRTSRTRSENHATRPNSQVAALLLGSAQHTAIMIEEQIWEPDAVACSPPCPRTDHEHEQCHLNPIEPLNTCVFASRAPTSSNARLPL